MLSSQQQQPQAAESSRTQTVTSSDTAINPATQHTTTSPAAPAILRLRGAHIPSANHVAWAEGVVDNEGLGRKSSKVCCIYHAPKAVGESSDESDSSSSSSDDSDSDAGGAGRRRLPDDDPRERAAALRRAAKEHERQSKEKESHHHDGECGHDHDHAEADHHPASSSSASEDEKDGRARKAGGKKNKAARRPSPNAYEKQPRPKRRPGDGGSAPADPGRKV